MRQHNQLNQTSEPHHLHANFKPGKRFKSFLCYIQVCQTKALKPILNHNTKATKLQRHKNEMDSRQQMSKIYSCFCPQWSLRNNNTRGKKHFILLSKLLTWGLINFHLAFKIERYSLENIKVQPGCFKELISGADTEK